MHIVMWRSVKIVEMADMKETVAVITVEGAGSGGGGHAGGGNASEQLTAIDWTDDGQLFYVATRVGHNSQLLVYLSRLAVVYSRYATRFACLTGLREIAVIDVVDQVLPCSAPAPPLCMCMR